MFEKMLADIAYQKWASPEAQAIRKMHGTTWETKNPNIQPMLPAQRKPRGREPQQWKRQESTIDRDWKAWTLRNLGCSYQEIAGYLGYDHRQTAYKAVARAQKEYLTYGGARSETISGGQTASRIPTQPLANREQSQRVRGTIYVSGTDLLCWDRDVSRGQRTRSGSSARGRKFPRVDPDSLGMKVKHTGYRQCGCYLRRGDRVALVNKRQWCVKHALEHAGLSWWDAVREPELFAKVKLYPGASVRTR